MEPIAVSPFIFEHPLKPADMVDREDESRFLLAAAQQGRFVRLVGPRRYGKTSLLRKVLEEAEPLGLVGIHVDFSGVISISDIVAKLERAYANQLKGDIRQKLQRLLESTELGLSLGPVGIATRSPKEVNSVAALEAILELPASLFKKSNKRGIIVFDEFQEILKIRRADALIRSKIQYQSDSISYTFCGSEPGMMRELFDSKARPLYGQTISCRLNRLKDSDLNEYIHVRFERTNRSAGEILPSLLRLADGHPQRIMLLAHELWQHTPEFQKSTAESWRAALKQVEIATTRECQELWRRLDPSEKRVCRAVLLSGTTPMSQEILETVELAKTTAYNAISRLIDRGEFEYTEDGKLLRFVDPLFHHWLKNQ